MAETTELTGPTTAIESVGVAALSSRPAPSIRSYEEALLGFDWRLAEKELEWGPGRPANLGFHLSDRLCRLGLGRKWALVWEGTEGQERRFTFEDLSLLSNGVARFFSDLGVGPGERVCLFLDRVPELYVAFVGLLKLGAVVQPLFSAFGDESLLQRLSDARTCAVLTQRKHLPKVRRARSRLPELRHVIVIEVDERGPGEGEVAFALEAIPRRSDFPIFPATPETPSVLHYTSGTTGLPKGAQHVHGSLISQYLTAKWALDLTPEDIYWQGVETLGAFRRTGPESVRFRAHDA